MRFIEELDRDVIDRSLVDAGEAVGRDAEPVTVDLVDRGSIFAIPARSQPFQEAGAWRLLVIRHTRLYVSCSSTITLFTRLVLCLSHVSSPSTLVLARRSYTFRAYDTYP